MVEKGNIPDQEIAYGRLKSDITNPRVHHNLFAVNNSAILSELNSDVRLLSSSRQRDLAIHIFNGITQRLPHQPWDLASQNTALAIFRHIDFKAMTYEALMSVRDNLVNAIEVHNLNSDRNDIKKSLFAAARHILAYLGPEHGVLEFKNEVKSLISRMGTTQPESFSSEQAFLVYLEHNAETIDRLRDKITTSKAPKARHTELQTRRTIVLLEHNRTAKEIGNDLFEAEDTIRNDIVWLRKEGFIGIKKTGSRVSEDVHRRRSRVLELADAEYPDIMKGANATHAQVHHDLDFLRKQGYSIEKKKGGQRKRKELPPEALKVLEFRKDKPEDIARLTGMTIHQVRYYWRVLIKRGLVEKKPSGRRRKQPKKG